MELLIIPAIGIFGLYIINTRDEKKQKLKNELFQNNNEIKNENNNYVPPVSSIFNVASVNEFSNNNYTNYHSGNDLPGKLYTANNENEKTLSNRNGNDYAMVSKNEQSPLFTEKNAIKWPNGMPSSSDYMQSRETENKSTKMNNIQPFESMKVTSGNYDDEETRNIIRDKTVDELRCKNNPKSSEMGLYGYEGPMTHPNTGQPLLGIVEKNRPETSFYNDIKNILPTLGQIRQSYNRPNQIERLPNKVNSTSEYYGPMQSSYDKQNTEYNNNGGVYFPSKRTSSTTLPLMSAHAKDKFNSDYKYREKTHIYTNLPKKTLYTENYFGPIKDTLGSILLPVLDVLKPSRKESMINNMKPYLRIQKAPTNTYVYDHTALPITLRESVENSMYEINSTAPKIGGYETFNLVLPDTVRDSTLSSHTGIACTDSRPRIYDPEYNMKVMSHRTDEISDRLVPGNLSTNYNMNDNNNTNITTMKSAMSADDVINNTIQSRELQPTNYKINMNFDHMGEFQDINKIDNNIIDNSYVLDQLNNNDLSIKSINYKK